MPGDAPRNGERTAAPFDSGYRIGTHAIALEHAPCCFCGTTAAAPVLVAGEDRLHGLPGRFSIVKCATCGLMRTDPRPTRASIGFYYPSDYAPYAQTDTETIAAPRRWGRSLSDPLDLAIPGRPPGHLLEIGAASGSFLKRMQLEGWNVTGVEPDATSAARAAQRTGATVHQSTIDDVMFDDNTFDAICAWMTFEHVHDPAEGFARCLRWLKPGGWLAFSVPDAGSWQFRAFRGQWFCLQLPTHLHHFTAPMLRTMLGKTGYGDVQVFWQRTLVDVPLSLAFAAEHVVPSLGRQPRAVALTLPFRAASRALGIVGAPLRLTGRLTVWAQKPL